MAKHEKGKAGEACDKPQVVEFVDYLVELRKARMTQKEHFEALGVGNTKLIPYLKGDAVPDARVLVVYFIAPFNDKRELTTDEHVQLVTLHRRACAAHPPREPTDDDKVAFLKHDLAHSEHLTAKLRKRLSKALVRNMNDSEQLKQMQVTREDLSVQTQYLQAQVTSLHCELNQREEEHRLALEGTGRERAVLVEATERALRECQRELAALEAAVTRHLKTVGNQRAKAMGLEREVEFLKQEVCDLQLQIQEERRLYMHLVLHMARRAPNRPAPEQELQNLRMRHELGEHIHAQLLEQNNRLLEQLDRLVTERDFLAAALNSKEPVLSPDAPTLPWGWEPSAFGEIWTKDFGEPNS